MYYSININQIAIATHNKNFSTNLDLIDGAIIVYLAQQSISLFAKKNFVVYENEVYYRICYDNIISQLPLINIENKEVIGRRIKKLEKAGVIKFYLDKKNNNKTYFTTTELFENFVSKVPTQKSAAEDLKVATQPTQKSVHIYDNNTNDNNITYSKEKTNKKEIPVSANFTHTQNYEDIIENFMQEKYPHLPEITKDSLRRFVGCMILEQQKRNKKELTRNEVIEIFAQIIKTLYPEIPNISILENVELVVKENLITESVEVKIAEKKNIDLFEDFWKAYPKKKAKEKARQVFQKLLSKAKNKEILAEQIMKGLELYNQDITQKQTKEEFIAHATTWLNQARWEDEYKTPQQNKINLSGQKLIQKPVYEVSEEDKKKQEQELKEYAKVKTEKSQFMEHFKSVLKNYFGSSHFSWIQSLKIKSINENEVVFMLQCQIYVDVIQRNKGKFEQVFNREFQGFYKEFDGKIKFVAWKI